MAIAKFMFLITSAKSSRLQKFEYFFIFTLKKKKGGGVGREAGVPLTTK